jgi:uncharacterized membrane protein
MALLDVLFRWLHILVGILWIGHLYFFNFVNGPLQGKLDGPTKKAVNPELLPRALYWFRIGALWTWVTGVVLLMLVFYHGGAVLQDPAGGFTAASWIMIAVTFLAVFAYDAILKSPLNSDVKRGNTVTAAIGAAIVLGFVFYGGFSPRGTFIHTGAMFGTIMAFNVWFRIWPAQQKIIRAVKEGTPPDADLVKLAGARSRHNTYLSVPLLFMMINQHASFFFGGNAGLGAKTYWIGLFIIIALGWHIVWQLYKKAGQVQGF